MAVFVTPLARICVSIRRTPSCFCKNRIKLSKFLQNVQRTLQEVGDGFD
jgi:hypothetical protein